jgi:hypothetical protein
MEVNGQLHITAALPPGKMPLYPLYRRMEEPRVGQDMAAKRKYPFPAPARNCTIVIQPTA